MKKQYVKSLATTLTTTMVAALILGFGFSIVKEESGELTWSHRNPASIPEGDSVKFKTDDGRTYRMSTDSKELSSKDSLRAIHKLDVSFNDKTFRCEDAKHTTWRMAEQIQSKMELRNIIDALKLSEKPRELNPAQKRMIERVPLCDPFLLELRVISYLVQDWDIVE